MYSYPRLSLFAILVATALLPAALRSQGMPPEARDNIHRLLNQHETVTRKVELTDKGYVATTESTDKAVAKALKQHVKQMEARLDSGLMVRRWDPAFAEYVRYYGDIEHRFEKTKNGVRAVVTGKTPEAIRVAQNHAQIVSDFALNGWEGHNRAHTAVVSTSGIDPKPPQATTAAEPAGCSGVCGAGGQGCCGGRARVRAGTTQ